MLTKNPCPEIEKALIRDMAACVFDDTRQHDREAVLANFAPDLLVRWRQWDAERPVREQVEADQEERQGRVAARKRILDAADIPGRFHGTRFDSLERDYCPEAYDACRQFAEADPRGGGGPQGLLLSGPAGTGKTALAIACLRASVERDCRPVRFVPMSRFMQDLRDRPFYAGTDAPQPPFMTMRDVTGYHLIVFDDLQRQRLTEWGETNFHDLVNELYNEGSRVICTTNAKRQEFLDAIDESTASRIDEMCVRVKVGGRNLRYPEEE